MKTIPFLLVASVVAWTGSGMAAEDMMKPRAAPGGGSLNQMPMSMGPLHYELVTEGTMDAIRSIESQRRINEMKRSMPMMSEDDIRDRVDTPYRSMDQVPPCSSTGGETPCRSF